MLYKDATKCFFMLFHFPVNTADIAYKDTNTLHWGNARCLY